MRKKDERNDKYIVGFNKNELDVLPGVGGGCIGKSRRKRKSKKESRALERLGER